MVLLPGISKNYLIKHGKELTGRKLHIDDISINYWRSSIQLTGFKMYESNETDVFTSFDTLLVNTIPYKYFSNTKALDQCYLKGLQVQIIKKDSTYNFDDLVRFYTQADSIPEDPEKAEEFKYLLQNIELKEAAINLYEADIDNTTRLQNISFAIPYVAWDQENDSKADMTLNFERGGSLQAAFNAHPKTLNFEGQFVLNKIGLSSFIKHVASYANINSVAGSLNAHINLSGNMDKLEDMVITGDTEVLNFSMTDQSDAKFYAAERMYAEYGEIKALKQAVNIKKVLVEQPFIEFQLDSVSNNWFRIFNIDTESDTEEVGAANAQVADSSAFYYAINNLKVTGGVMDYTDNLTGKPFSYHLIDIKVDTDSITSDSQWVDVTSDMLLNNRGTLKAKVGVNPVDPLNAKIDIAIKDFVLSDLNIYSNYYTGHSILQGDMYYFSQTEFEQGNIESENQLLIKDVSVENNKNGLMSLPLKFAIFLLKDKNGDIELEVPVRGNLNEPEVDVWSLVGTTLKKIIFGATDNPTKRLAKLVDAKPEELQQLVFQYPDTLLTEGHKKQLKKILELEQLKPELQITMSYAVDPLELKKLILQTSQASTVQEQNNASREENVEGRPINELTIPSEMTATSDSLVNQYGEALMRQMKTYLATVVPNTAIQLEILDQFDPETMVAEPQFKMEYRLKELEQNRENL